MEIKKMEPGRQRPVVKEQWLFPEFAEQTGGGRSKKRKVKKS